MFTQMSEKLGIKKNAEKAVAAMRRESRKIDKGPMSGKPVVTPINPYTVSFVDKRNALEAVNMIK